MKVKTRWRVCFLILFIALGTFVGYRVTAVFGIPLYFTIQGGVLGMILFSQLALLTVVYNNSIISLMGVGMYVVSFMTFQLLEDVALSNASLLFWLFVSIVTGAISFDLVYNAGIVVFYGKRRGSEADVLRNRMVAIALLSPILTYGVHIFLVTYNFTPVSSMILGLVCMFAFVILHVYALAPSGINETSNGERVARHIWAFCIVVGIWYQFGMVRVEVALLLYLVSYSAVRYLYTYVWFAGVTLVTGNMHAARAYLLVARFLGT